MLSCRAHIMERRLGERQRCCIVAGERKPLLWMTVWKIFPSKSAQISAGVFIINTVPFDICDERFFRVCTCTDVSYVLNIVLWCEEATTRPEEVPVLSPGKKMFQKRQLPLN